jgi:hypothetical protein
VAYQVRVTASFFDAVEQQLPAERGPHGEPSAHDFLAVDLLGIVDQIAEGWDTLPELIPGRSDYRQFIGSGRMVYAFTAIGQLAPDGTVELVDIEIDPW